MRIKERKHHRSGRGGAVLLATGVMIGLLLVTPAGAHVTSSINHLVKHVKNAILPITSKELGTVSLRTGDVVVPGGAPANGNYDQEFVTVMCQPGEEALSWTGFWAGADIEGGPGGGDDLELLISYVRREATVDQQGFVVGAGNDTATDITFRVQVLCLAK
jgi:hypothetical protein